MKNVIIVLICVVLFGAIGFMGTAEISRRSQNAQQEADEAKLPPIKEDGSLESLNRTSMSANVSMENLRKRQNYAMVGGGVGAAAGLVVGLGTGMLLGKKKAA